MKKKLLIAVMIFWRERWNALIGLGLAAVLYVAVEVLEAIL